MSNHVPTFLHFVNDPFWLKMITRLLYLATVTIFSSVMFRCLSGLSTTGNFINTLLSILSSQFLMQWTQKLVCFFDHVLYILGAANVMFTFSSAPPHISQLYLKNLDVVLCRTLLKTRQFWLNIVFINSNRPFINRIWIFINRIYTSINWNVNIIKMEYKF